MRAKRYTDEDYAAMSIEQQRIHGLMLSAERSIADILSQFEIASGVTVRGVDATRYDGGKYTPIIRLGGKA